MQFSAKKLSVLGLAIVLGSVGPLSAVTSVHAAESDTAISDSIQPNNGGTLDDLIDQTFGKSAPDYSGEINWSDTIIHPSSKSFSQLYAELSPEDKANFDTLASHYGWADSEKTQFLQSKAGIADDPAVQARWKVAVIKAVFKAAAKVLGAKMGEKTLSDWVNYLTNFEGDMQDGIQSFLVTQMGWNSTAAYWTARTIVFLAF